MSQLDVARSTGLGYARLRRRESAELRAQGGQPRNSVYRAIWEEAAAAVGAEYEQLSEDFAELRRDGARTRVKRQGTELDAEVTLDIASHKGLVHGWLTGADIPVPEHHAFDYRDLDSGAEFLARANGACVVKPGSDTGGGWGLAANVRTRDQLARAVLNASRYSSKILIERQIPGDLHRILVLDGEVIDVVRRRSPTVVGDDRSTVRELIAAENRRRLDARGHAGLWALRVDLDCLFALEARGETLDAVPPSGALVTVKHVTNENRLEDNETVHEIGDGIRAESRKAAELVGLRLAGLDVIATDMSRSLKESGGVVLEVNGAPGLSHHYHVADRTQATRVAVPILETLLSRRPKD